MTSLALLIGGRGSRLGGVDKASLVLPSGRTTSAAIVDAFGPHVDAMFALGRADQHDHPLSQTMPIVIDAAPDEGPLRAIATALFYARTPWVVVVACDQVGLVAGDLTALTEHRARGRLAVAWRSPAGPEPLCALYHRALVSRAQRLLERGERRASALLEHAHLVPRASGIGNVNDPSDAAGLGIV